MNNWASLQTRGWEMLQELKRSGKTPQVQQETLPLLLTLAVDNNMDADTVLPPPLADVALLIPRDQWPEGMEGLMEQALAGNCPWRNKAE